MTTQEYLSKYGVTLEEAKDFVMNNLDHIDVIYNTAKEFGINNDMLADIVSNDFPGVTGEIISNFFSEYGLNGQALGFNTSDTSQLNTVGTLNLSDVGKYHEVILLENVSLGGIQELSGNFNFAYASNDTWDSITDLGFQSDYTQKYGGAVEYAYNSDHTEMAIGLDFAQNNAELVGVVSQYGITANDINSYVGPYDAIIAYN